MNGCRQGFRNDCSDKFTFINKTTTLFPISTNFPRPSTTLPPHHFLVNSHLYNSSLFYKATHVSNNFRKFQKIIYIGNMSISPKLAIQKSGIKVIYKLYIFSKYRMNLSKSKCHFDCVTHLIFLNLSGFQRSIFSFTQIKKILAFVVYVLLQIA